MAHIDLDLKHQRSCQPKGEGIISHLQTGGSGLGARAVKGLPRPSNVVPFGFGVVFGLGLLLRLPKKRYYIGGSR